MIELRLTEDGTRRPLIVVYDEAQNLSDLQTNLLLELEPTAFLLASATLRFPARFVQTVIDPLKANGWTDETLVTVVDAQAAPSSTRPGIARSTSTPAW